MNSSLESSGHFSWKDVVRFLYIITNIFFYQNIYVYVSNSVKKISEPLIYDLLYRLLIYFNTSMDKNVLVIGSY